MAKKKTKKKTKKVPKKNAKPVMPWKTTDALVTDFLHQYRLFLTDPDPQNHRDRVWNWPPAGEPRPTSLDTVRGVVDMLVTALKEHTPPPAGVPGTVLAQVAACVSGYPWPTSPRYTVKNGKPYGFPPATVNLYEVAQVVDLMLQAINGGGKGGGGGGPRWPPVN